MNGLIDRAIEEFLRATYGDDLVRSMTADIALAQGNPVPDLQGCGQQALAHAAARMSKPVSEMLEDLGGWLTRIEPIRRLLRFSGRDFRDFLMSLDELPGRAHLVLPQLVMPPLRVARDGQGVIVAFDQADADWKCTLTGLIRGMADDYGALCLISSEGMNIRVDIWEEQFCEGRMFSLCPDVVPESMAF